MVRIPAPKDNHNNACIGIPDEYEDLIKLFPNLISIENFVDEKGQPFPMYLVKKADLAEALALLAQERKTLPQVDDVWGKM